MDDNPSDNETAEPDPQPGTGPEGGEPQLSDAEREMLEQQMREIRVEDLLTQTVASVLNLSARRIVKEDEVDLEQARIGIDAVRAILPLLPAEVGEAVREPLSQVQMLFAQRSGGEPSQPAGEGQPPGAGGPSQQTEPGSGAPADGGPQRPQQPGGSGLWTPGGS
jgi:hypothetical protein